MNKFKQIKDNIQELNKKRNSQMQNTQRESEDEEFDHYLAKLTKTKSALLVGQANSRNLMQNKSSIGFYDKISNDRKKNNTTSQTRIDSSRPSQMNTLQFDTEKILGACMNGESIQAQQQTM